MLRDIKPEITPNLTLTFASGAFNVGSDVGGEAWWLPRTRDRLASLSGNHRAVATLPVRRNEASRISTIPQPFDRLYYDYPRPYTDGV